MTMKQASLARLNSQRAQQQAPIVRLVNAVRVSISVDRLRAQWGAK